MRESNPQTIYLKDYQQPPFWAESVDLDFKIFESHTTITAKTHFVRNQHLVNSDGKMAEVNSSGKPHSLNLNGDFFKLISIKMDDQVLNEADYQKTESGLSLVPKKDNFTLEVVTELDPSKNTSLEGLYKSGDIICTQNESQGFRRITYFLDRPDVMSIYSTRIEADKTKFPVLLSNGNLVSHKDLSDNRHEVVWQDPFKKPCYLYALVAGDLGKIDDYFTTKSGRKVKLEIYVDKGNEKSCLHAMTSLKKSMKWDEERFGLEYDLDIYMIVAVNSFNAGAMENKGLNIFNSKYVLAQPETATDDEYLAIEAVIGHEYFHNWSGNRVTCRDWFQLSLKEGLTVFRDQEFTSDLHSRAVKRIEDVQHLRSRQFAEDSGPMAHPIRPSSYVAINNFYTLTVYEKGAEVVRMIQTILGKDSFTKALKKYFVVYDGKAATTDDFVDAMEESSGIDLSQFRNWYCQAGTPLISFVELYNEQKQTYTLTLKQRLPSHIPQNEQGERMPFHLPVSIGLVGEKGQDIPLHIETQTKENKGKKLVSASGKDGDTTRVLHLTEYEQTFIFRSVKSKPALSIFREFSAPVKVENVRTNEELIFLMKNDSDSFNRWEAGQTLALQAILDLIQKKAASLPYAISQELLKAFAESLQSQQAKDPAYAALLWTIPDESYISQQLESVDPYLVKEARDYFIHELALENKDLIVATYNRQIETNEFETDSAKRSLKSTLLSVLVKLDPVLAESLARQLFAASRNMTNRLSALSILNKVEGVARTECMKAFYTEFKDDAVTIDKWLMLKGTSEIEDPIAELEATTQDPVFDVLVPNKIYALLVAFGNYNTKGFHRPDGKGYGVIADWVIKIDKTNPQVASRLASVFNLWKRLEPKRRALMKAQIEKISKSEGISPNVFEIISRALA